MLIPVQGAADLSSTFLTLGDLGGLFVGWALGILSSPITDAIRRRSVKKRITRALRTEMQTLQDTLAMVVVQVSRRRGSLTRSLLEALLSTLRTSGHAAEPGKAYRAIEDLLDADGEGPATRGDARLVEGPISPGIPGLPFLETHLHRLDFYTHETQRQLLEIRAGLDVFNRHAEEAGRYHFMTFSPGIDAERRGSLLANVERCHERAGEKASELVGLIAALLQNPEMRVSVRRR